MRNEETIAQRLRYVPNGGSIEIEGVTIYRSKPATKGACGELYHIGACGMKAAFAGPLAYESAIRRGWRGEAQS